MEPRKSFQPNRSETYPSIDPCSRVDARSEARDTASLAGTPPPRPLRVLEARPLVDADA
jgi:hypothetical protein